MNHLKYEEWPENPGIWVDFAAGSLPRPYLQPAVWNVPALHSLADKVRNRDYRLENLLRLLADGAEANSARTLESIDRLRRPETVVVVTTIHASLFGGPVFQFLKCMSAIKACRELAKHAIEAVPVCWISTAPPLDFSRWTVSLLDHGGELHQLRLQPENSDFSMADPLPEGQIAELLGKTKELGQGTYDVEIIEVLRAAHSPGATISSATAHLLLDLMKDWGMIVLDPGAPGFKPVLAGAAAVLRRRADKIKALLREQAANLAEAGYVEPSLDDSPPDFPEQSCVLPVIAAVIDPYELHSFIKALPVFDELGLSRPLACPQPGATILDTRSRRTLGKYRLDIRELFSDEGEVIRKIRQGMPHSARKKLEDLALEVELKMAELGALIPAGDEILVTRDSCKRRIIYQIERMRERCEDAGARREQAANRQIHRARSFLAPNGRSQERGLSGIQFLLRYSRAVLQLLYEKLDILKLEHQLIPMD